MVTQPELSPTISTPRPARLSELPQFFRRIAQCEEFIIYDNGLRGWTYRYADIARMAESFARRLDQEGIRKGDAVMICSESRPGWIAALWGCLLRGVIVVPIEPRTSLDFFRKVEQKVHSTRLILGENAPGALASGPSVIRMSEIEQRGGPVAPEPIQVCEDDIAEIVFTSGTTAEPKGVVITHRNLAAQIGPIEAQLAPYRKYVRPFAPLRILNLLPMSHLFGQSLATFVPPMIPASVLLISTISPREIVRQIHSRRVVILVSVPRVLEALRDYIVHRFPATADTSRAADAWPRLWWRYRDVHRALGWKFCCVLSGGAPLPADLERFWINLGFVVVQGYGLTETAPVISFTHPFHVQPGTTGKPLAGVDVKIASDGEILVRGDNVTPGYFHAPDQTRAAFLDGWLQTGDLGELDVRGNLIIRGRKKETIVTPEGLKVYPEDVEAVLDRLPGVRESAVIGKGRVQAVLVLDPGVNANEVVREANARLEDHQRIRSVSVWPGPELPRTQTTRKLRRLEIADVIERSAAQPTAKPIAKSGGDLEDLLQKYAPGRTLGSETTIEELGLSSLDRIELMMDLEKKLNISIDERAFASIRKVADLAKPMPEVKEPPFPSFNRNRGARAIRRIALDGMLLPLTSMFARPQVSGLENLAGMQGPVVFASNHQSHVDTPVILTSLPARWRRRIAPAMWKEYFDAHFHPERHTLLSRWANSIVYGLITLLFNTFPLPQTETGAGESVRYMGELVEEGWSILIFPEGEHSLTGEIRAFFPGVGLMASRLDLPVVPIRLRGTAQVLPHGSKRPRRGQVRVSIGAPIYPGNESYAALARRIEDAVRAL